MGSCSWWRFQHTQSVRGQGFECHLSKQAQLTSLRDAETGTTIDSKGGSLKEGAGGGCSETDTGSDCKQPLKSLEEFQRANNSIKCHRENKNDMH